MKRITTFRLFLPVSMIVLGFTNEIFSQVWNPAHSVGTVTGKYHFAYNQTPDQLVEVYPAAVPNTGLTYQWEQSTVPLSGFTAISGATGTSYTFSAALSQTMYYRRKTTNSVSQFIYSNIIKITVVSVNWEDHNYIREHIVNTTGITTWQAVDQLAIGPKLQTTTYLDGLGRNTQSVIREAATPASGVSLWGDVVMFTQYDAMGREPKSYLPYTSSAQSGKYKTAAVTDQASYFTSVYNESSPFSNVSYDNSPLRRILNVKQPGTAWAASAGNSVAFDLNTLADNVPEIVVDYNAGNPPVYKGVYAANTLLKHTYTDVNGKQVIQFMNTAGMVVLRKVQLDDSPAGPFNGWICTYTVYDEFGRIRFQLEPEAVKYFAANSWTFTGTTAAQILNERSFQYMYDEKGRTTFKKSPGIAPLRMLYDARDRVVFTQDGNQAALATPQWTANIYDELDRQVIKLLYNTTKTATALQTDIDNAVIRSGITISNTTNNGGSSITVAASFAVVSATDLNNPAVTTPVLYFFYDNYSFPNVRTFNTAFTNLTAYSTSDPNIIPISASQRVTELPTGQRSRVLGSNSFLTSTYYYNDRGDLTQIQSDNIKGGSDIATLQYHFNGKIVSTCADHTTTGTGYTAFKILTKFNFDKLARVTSIDKQFGSNAIETVSSLEYDDLGRLKTKRLDPGYTTGGNSDLESLVYSYNLQSQLTGINKDYALKTAASYNKWGHFFGLYLGYDNRDNAFTASRLNGAITGAIWNSQGDDNQRKYNYTYDNAGRLTSSLFTEQAHPGDGWSNAKMDFSVTGNNSGKIGYDLNGNLSSMLHKSVLPGSTTPFNLDNLTYTSNTNSNKLLHIADGMTTPAINGQYGDFKDGTNAAGSADYVYDANGNVVVDLNKNIQSLNGGAAGTNGVSYNYLDKPELVRIVGKGTVRTVYNANGEKLQRAFIPEAGGASAITTYISEFVYQESATITTSTVAPLGGTPSLSYINFEEGRIRVITPVTQNNGYDFNTISGNLTLPNSKAGVFDYFILDYQQTVRMVLTEETHNNGATCTMETTRSSTEAPLFGQTGAANEVETTRFAKPTGWTNTNLGTSVSRLGNISTKNLGPNTLQKVMAGDKVTATVQYYFQAATGGDNANIANTVLSGLMQAVSGGSAAGSVLKNNVSAISGQLGSTTGFLNAVKPTGAGGTTPQAYLTILFFDERFKFIEASDGGVYQQQVASSVTSNGSSLGVANVKAPKNGYVYIYVSNRSDQDVYFDNLLASITRGNLVEENHYYSFGLKIAAISSRKAGDLNEGSLKNEYLFQGEFADYDEETSWTNFSLRGYDAQTGRFNSPDPYNQFSSPYTGMGNDPVNNVDPNGGLSINFGTIGQITGSILLDRALITLGGSAIGFGIDKLTGGNGWTGAAIGGGLALGATFIPPFDIGGLGSLLSNTAGEVGPGLAAQGAQLAVYTVSTGATNQYVQFASNVKWQPLYKKDLIAYAGSTDDNVLGATFERLFGAFALTDPLMRSSNVRPHGIGKFTGGFRNTAPDFVGDAFVSEKKGKIRVNTTIKGADWYELKQKTGGLYLSSNEDQIAGHIDNMRNSADYAYKKYGRLGYQSKLYIVTTADVKYSDDIYERAYKNNVLYEHIHAEFRIVNNKWEFRFKKTISTNQKW